MFGFVFQAGLSISNIALHSSNGCGDQGCPAGETMLAKLCCSSVLVLQSHVCPVLLVSIQVLNLLRHTLVYVEMHVVFLRV